MQVPTDLTEITDSALKLEIELDESNYIEDFAALDLTWIVEEFNEKSMKI